MEMDKLTRRFVDSTKELDAVLPYLQSIDVEHLPLEKKVELIKDLFNLMNIVEKLNSDIKGAVVLDAINKTKGGK